MHDDRFAFDLPAFAATVGNNEFYQNPDNPAEKQALLQLRFNYPVDPAEFERVGLVLVGRDGRIRPAALHRQLRQDEDERMGPLAVARDPARSAGGTARRRQGREECARRNGTPDVLHASVDVPRPCRSTTLRRRSSTTSAAEQVLVAEASDGVRSADLAARKAWVLPKRKPVSISRTTIRLTHGTWPTSATRAEAVEAAAARRSADRERLRRCKVPRDAGRSHRRACRGRPEIGRRLPTRRAGDDHVHGARLSEAAALHG